MSVGDLQAYWPLVACVGSLLLVLLVVALILELRAWRREEQAAHAGFERTGGWRASSPGLAAVLLGLIFGGVSAALLLGPLQKGVLDWLAFRSLFPTAAFSRFALLDRLSTQDLVMLCLALILLLAPGPLCSFYIAQPTRGGSRRIAALAGAATFGVASALAIETAAACIGQQAFLTLALSLVPYTEIGYLLALGQSVYQIFPWIYATFAACLLIGAGTGALLGSLVYTVEPARRPVNWSAPLVQAAAPLLVLVLLVNVILFALLDPAVQNILDQGGIVPPGLPQQILTLSAGLPLAVLVIIQLMSLSAAHRAKRSPGGPLPVNQRWMVSTGLAVVGLIDLGIAYTVHDAALLAYPVLMLGLLMLAGSIRLARYTPPAVETALYRSPSWDEEPVRFVPPPPGPILPHWGIMGMAGGLLAGLVGQLSLVAVLSMVLLSVPALEPVALLRSPALDSARLQTLLGDTFSLTFFYALLTIGIFTLVGGGLGLLLQWTQNNLFLPILWVSLAGIGRNGAPGAMQRLIAITAGLLLGLLLVFFPQIGPGPLMGISALLALLLIARSLPMRLPRWGAAACCIIAGAGLTVYTLPAFPGLGVSDMALRPLYALLVGPCLGVAAAGLLSLSWVFDRPAAGAAVLCAAALLIALPGSQLGASGLFEGQVVTYDGQSWQPVDLSSTGTGRHILYYFYPDHQGGLWLTSQTGLLLHRLPAGWETYLLSDTDDSGLASSSNAGYLVSPAFLTESGGGAFWAVSRSNAGLFRPSAVEAGHYFEAFKYGGAPAGEASTGAAQDGAEETVVRIPSDHLITGLDTGPSGDLWLGTLGGGVIRVDGNRPASDARWTVYAAAPGGPRSPDVVALLADSQGRVWVSSYAGLDRWSGGSWQPVTSPDLPAVGTINDLLEDPRGWIWAGSDMGGARWDGSRWLDFRADPGWPAAFKVDHLYQDGAGRVVAAGQDGALRYTGAGWETLVRGQPVSAFASSGDITWLGGAKGLTRLDSSGKHAYDPASMGFSFNYVADLYLDPGGTLWASTGKMVEEPMPGWGLPLAAGLVFAVLLILLLLGTPRRRGKKR